MTKAKPTSKAKKAKPAPTFVSFLLDRSGSMDSVKPATIEAFNAYVKSLQQDLGDGLQVEFTFLQFDTMSLDKIYVAEPIAKVALLDNHSFMPRGGTPLIDAAVKTIRATEAALKARTDKPKVVVCIQTDGEENSSTEFKWADLNQLIKEKTAQGWQFNFMGAGIDAYKQSSLMGISSVNTVSYDKHSTVATTAMFAESASNTRGFGTGLRASTAYTGAQKMAAGDMFDPSLQKHAAIQRNLTGASQQRKTVIVDDIDLGKKS